VDIASDLFYQQGYHCTGVQQIIQSAGIAKGTFYSHFKSKEELGLAWLESRHNLWNGNLLKKTSPINEPKQKIVALFEMLEQWIEDNNFRGCAFLNTLSETPDPESPLREIIAQHKEDLRFEIGRLLDACGSDKGKYRDIVFLLFEGALIESQNFRKTWPVSAAKKHVEQLIA